MKLHLNRTFKKDTCTIGELFIDGIFECFVLEDVDRGLTQDMPLTEIVKIKVPHRTAIPTGTYKVIISFSNRFQKRMPEILNVPGFAGIRMHSGNTSVDTDGCPLLGTDKDEVNNSISNSRVAFNRFFLKLEAAKDAVEIMIF